LEQKQVIRIFKEPNYRSYALQGEAIDNDDFKQWVEYAEASPTVSLIEAKQRWADQRKKLQSPDAHQNLVMERFEKVRRDPDRLLDWDEAKKSLKAWHFSYQHENSLHFSHK